MDDTPRRTGSPDKREGLDEQQVRRIALVGALLLVVILALVFIVENSDPVRVSFVFFSASISLIWVILLSMAMGAIAGAVLMRLIRKRFFADHEE
ncbi:MAG: LapA family protein [Miltoncostaeaceae bacterium]